MANAQPFFEVVVIGGSYSGLAAGLALARAMRTVLIIDSNKPCNRQTPHSHNFLTQDGKTPAEISALAKQQVLGYSTVEFLTAEVIGAKKSEDGFIVTTAAGASFKAKKLIFATGISDSMASIDGFAECWGISVLHCPYCHGYEVRDKKTGILGNGQDAFELAILISHWTRDLTIFTNGTSTLAAEQSSWLSNKNIRIEESELSKLQHDGGYLQEILFKDGSSTAISALYARRPFKQHCPLPELLGCELTERGYLKVEPSQKTTIEGVYACGDNSTYMRTVATAVAAGTAAGMNINKELILEESMLVGV